MHTSIVSSNNDIEGQDHPSEQLSLEVSIDLSRCGFGEDEITLLRENAKVRNKEENNTSRRNFLKFVKTGDSWKVSHDANKSFCFPLRSVDDSSEPLKVILQKRKNPDAFEKWTPKISKLKEIDLFAAGNNTGLTDRESLKGHPGCGKNYVNNTPCCDENVTDLINCADESKKWKANVLKKKIFPYKQEEIKSEDCTKDSKAKHLLEIGKPKSRQRYHFKRTSRHPLEYEDPLVAVWAVLEFKRQLKDRILSSRNSNQAELKSLPSNNIDKVESCSIRQWDKLSALAAYGLTLVRPPPSRIIQSCNPEICVQKNLCLALGEVRKKKTFTSSKSILQLPCVESAHTVPCLSPTENETHRSRVLGDTTPTGISKLNNDDFIRKLKAFDRKKKNLGLVHTESLSISKLTQSDEFASIGKYEQFSGKKEDKSFISSLSEPSEDSKNIIGELQESGRKKSDFKSDDAALIGMSKPNENNFVNKSVVERKKRNSESVRTALSSISESTQIDDFAFLSEYVGFSEKKEDYPIISNFTESARDWKGNIIKELQESCERKESDLKLGDTTFTSIFKPNKDEFVRESEEFHRKKRDLEIDHNVLPSVLKSLQSDTFASASKYETLFKMKGDCPTVLSLPGLTRDWKASIKKCQESELKSKRSDKYASANKFEKFSEKNEDFPTISNLPEVSRDWKPTIKESQESERKKRGLPIISSIQILTKNYGGNFIKKYKSLSFKTSRTTEDSQASFNREHKTSDKQIKVDVPRILDHPQPIQARRDNIKSTDCKSFCSAEYEAISSRNISTKNLHCSQSSFSSSSSLTNLPMGLLTQNNGVDSINLIQNSKDEEHLKTDCLWESGNLEPTQENNKNSKPNHPAEKKDIFIGSHSASNIDVSVSGVSETSRSLFVPLSNPSVENLMRNGEWSLLAEYGFRPANEPPKTESGDPELQTPIPPTHLRVRNDLFESTSTVGDDSDNDSDILILESAPSQRKSIPSLVDKVPHYYDFYYQNEAFIKTRQKPQSGRLFRKSRFNQNILVEVYTIMRGLRLFLNHDCRRLLDLNDSVIFLNVHLQSMYISFALRYQYLVTVFRFNNNKLQFKLNETGVRYDTYSPSIDDVNKMVSNYVQLLRSINNFAFDLKTYLIFLNQLWLSRWSLA